MIKFPSINQFRNVVSHGRQQARFMGLDGNGEAIMNPAPVYPTMSFVGTVKLHGTNAANGFDHKKLGGPIAQASKRWFVQKLNEQALA